MYVALWKQSTLNADPANFIDLPECISTDLNMIHIVTLENVLTLSSRGDSVCLVEMKLLLQEKGDDGEHICLLSLHFEANKYGKAPTLQDIEHEMVQRFKALRKNLTLFPAVKFGYIITDMNQQQLDEASRINVPFVGIPVDKRWESQNQSPFFKIATNVANLGFNIASTLIGKPNADRIVTHVEGVTWDVIDTLSRVTEFSRDTAANALEHPLSRPILPYIPTKIRNMFLSNREVEDLLESYDSAGLYLQRWGEEMVRRPSNSPVSTKPVDITREYEIIKVFDTLIFINQRQNILLLKRIHLWESKSLNRLKH